MINLLINDLPLLLSLSVSVSLSRCYLVLSVERGQIVGYSLQ